MSATAPAEDKRNLLRIIEKLLDSEHEPDFLLKLDESESEAACRRRKRKARQGQMTSALPGQRSSAGLENHLLAIPELPLADVVSVKGIGAAVLVEKTAVTAETVVVGPFGRCRYREGMVEITGLKDSLGKN